MIAFNTLLLFSTIKNWVISKSDQLKVYSEEWMVVNVKPFEVQMQHCSQEIPAPENKYLCSWLCY